MKKNARGETDRKRMSYCVAFSRTSTAFTKRSDYGIYERQNLQKKITTSQKKEERRKTDLATTFFPSPSLSRNISNYQPS